MEDIREEQARHRAQEQLLLENLPMVRPLALRIRRRLPKHVDIEDLVSAGVVGLIDALAKFDPAKNVQFGCYARPRVQGAILDSLRKLDWSPRQLRTKARAVEKAIQALTGRHLRSPSEAEVAAELGLGIREYQKLRCELTNLKVGSLNYATDEETGEEKLDHLPDRSGDDPLSRCMRGEIEGFMANAISRLPERERLLLRLYYHEEVPLKDIAQILGVCVSRSSQIHGSAIMHLRIAIEELDGEGVLSQIYPRTRRRNQASYPNSFKAILLQKHELSSIATGKQSACSIHQAVSQSQSFTAAAAPI
jgi:RNA polymerase sigma factor for flagellar operon FliA